MCFQIATKQKKWTQKTVYKCLNLHEEKLNGICYVGPRWWANTTIKMNDGNTTMDKIGMGDRAWHGIYVYRTKRHARQSGWLGNIVVVSLKVDPKDFLYHDSANGQATYREVYLDEKQTEIDFK